MTRADLQNEQLVVLAQAGDAEALAVLCKKNRPFVASIALKFHTQHLHLDDLIQSGMVGMLVAISKFEPERGNRFTTMAYAWIWQACNRAIELTEREIQIPINLLADKSRVEGLPCVTRSLDETITTNDGTETRLGDLLADDDGVNPEDILFQRWEADRIAALMASADLTPHERRAVTLRFGLDGCGERTLQITGAALGMTREGTRQMVNRALSKLRAASEEGINEP